MTTPAQITGDLVKTRRGALALSRDAFAKLVELTPGAVWRIENKNSFKRGEREHLAQVADRWLDVPAEPVDVPAQPTPTTVPATVYALPNGTSEEDLEPGQWLECDDVPRLAWMAPYVFGPQQSQAWGKKLDGLVYGVITESAAYAEQDLLPGLKPGDLTLTFESTSPTALTELDGVARHSNSEVQSFKDCPRRWWLSYYRGLRPKLESPVGARAVGDRGHRALSFWYVGAGETRTDPRDALERLIVEDWTKLAQAYVEEGVPDDLAKTFTTEANLERAILEGYVQWVHETGADADYEIVGSERYLEAKLTLVGGEPVYVVGKLDARVRRLSDGVRLLMDHKFVGDFTRPLRTLHLDEQMLWYMLLEQLQPNEQQPAAGALYNMLRRVKRTPKATPPFYRRVEVHHNDIELASFTRRTRGTLTRLHEVKTELDTTSHPGRHLDIVPPRPTQDCAWKCPFVSVCGMFDDGSRVEDALKTHFIEGDPYTYYTASTTAAQEVVTA